MTQGSFPMATMNISLPDPMKNWVEEHLKEGSFSNSSDYVRHLIRKDQERTAAVKLLQQEIDKGLQSNEPKPFDLKSSKEAY
jgi:putative addiction module antidote protein, CC2985 family